MRRLAAGLVMMVVAVLAAAWILAPAPPEPIEEPPARRRLLRSLAEAEIELPAPAPRKKRTKKKAKAVDVRPQAPGAVARGQLAARTFDGGPPIAQQVQQVVNAPIKTPGGVDDPEVAHNRGYWKHGQKLEKLETSLLARLGNKPDPYEKFELQVALAEVYRAKVGNYEQFRAPSAWGDVRTERWLDKLDQDLAIAQDKAQMLLDISEKESSRWPEDDPAVQRLKGLR